MHSSDADLSAVGGLKCRRNALPDVLDETVTKMPTGCAVSTLARLHSIHGTENTLFSRIFASDSEPGCCGYLKRGTAQDRDDAERKMERARYIARQKHRARGAHAPTFTNGWERGHCGANEKLVIMHYPSRKRSPKRLIVHVLPHFQIRSGATGRVFPLQPKGS